MVFSITGQISHSQAVTYHAKARPAAGTEKACADGECAANNRTASSQVQISAEAKARLEVTASTEVAQSAGTFVNPYASAIVSFMDAQLHRDRADGASSAALQSRLQAGLDGFLAGFNEAFQQLQALAEFAGRAEAQVKQTEFQVLQAINELAGEFGLEPPVSELPPEPEIVPAETKQQALPAEEALEQHPSIAEVVANAGSAGEKMQLKLLESLTETLRQNRDTYAHLGKAKAAVNHQQVMGETRNFDLRVKTRDGDTVTLTINAEQAAVAQWQASQVDFAQQHNNALAFTVEGELDDGELRAITGLLNDVNALAKTFFSGDLDAAFAEAMKLQMDDSELAAFALGLTQVKLNAVSSTTSHPIEAEREVFAGLKDYARALVAEVEHFKINGYTPALLLDFMQQLEQIRAKTGVVEFSRKLTDMAS